MVRFGRLTSWRSWDLLHVDSEIPESPSAETKATASGCQVRRLLTRLCATRLCAQAEDGASLELLLLLWAVRELLELQ